MSFASVLPMLTGAAMESTTQLLAGVSGLGLYLLLLVLAAVVAGCLWRLCAATCAFAADVLIPLLKVILIVVLWIVLILLVNKLELIGADFSKLMGDFHTDFARLMADVKAPLFA